MSSSGANASLTFNSHYFLNLQNWSSSTPAPRCVLMLSLNRVPSVGCICNAPVFTGLASKICSWKWETASWHFVVWTLLLFFCGYHCCALCIPFSESTALAGMKDSGLLICVLTQFAWANHRFPTVEMESNNFLPL